MLLDIILLFFIFLKQVIFDYTLGLWAIYFLGSGQPSCVGYGSCLMEFVFNQMRHWSVIPTRFLAPLF